MPDAGWHDPAVPAQQAELSAREYVTWQTGGVHGPYDAARTLLGMASPVDVLDVGCGCGAYRRLIADCFPSVGYRGCDYSLAMTAYARAAYPGIEFREGDQRHLPYPDAAADCVFHGCCLIHIGIDEWATALAEAVRVARRWVLLHRTPIRVGGRPTRGITKTHYGVTISETHVAEAAFSELLADARLHVVATSRWNEGQDPEQVSLLCQKEA